MKENYYDEGKNINYSRVRNLYRMFCNLPNDFVVFRNNLNDHILIIRQTH